MNSKRSAVSGAVIRRLPRYYRCLEQLEAEGTVKISSRELARIMDLTASQIRQDLNCFGGFGQQGYGYSVSSLKGEVASILRLDGARKAILLGAGNLGKAIIGSLDFRASGFEMLAIFDTNEWIVGSEIKEYPVLSLDKLEEFCHQHHPVAAILCVPKEGAEQMVPRLVELGVRSFLNFSHYDIDIDYQNVAVENVYLADSLMTLSYKTAALEEEPD